MNIKKIAAMLAALCCIACTASCGREIPNSNEEIDSDITLSGGETDSDDEESGDDETIELVPRTTAAKTTAERSTLTTVSGQYVSLVTRSKEEISNLNSSKKTSVAKPPVNSKKTSSATKTAAKNTNSSAISANGTGTGSVTVTGTGSTSTQAPTTPVGATIPLSYTSAEILEGGFKPYATVSGSYNEIWTSSDTNVATVDQYGNITAVSAGTCTIRVTDANNSNVYGEITITVKKPEGKQEIDGITYYDGVLIANKSYSLPKSYNPGSLTSDTYSAFQSLVQSAANDGINIYLSSGFRSYETQEQIYNEYVSNHGQATADTFSARPGHSEHQTGMAIDVNTIDDSFAGTPEAIWLEEHCTEYGFIIRYPKGKQDITGYKYEPWHIRYVGKDVAQAIKNHGAAIGDPYITLEEYFSID
ncbi:MAG: D-alanyl-D-alanine carboxypeptidase family protein [Ruminococcus sp.]|nr:D-alanyl-D-alanine carboxypeptidase family protein [Ruminococcus sp.]